MKAYWSRFLHWHGWKKMFPFPFRMEVLMFFACGAGLIWVFLNGLELWWPAYILYVLSAYFLMSICIKLPHTVRSEQNWLKQYPRMEQLLKNKELRFSLGLYIEQFINFTYGFFKILSGIIVGSAWIGADGIYNLVQALIQLFQILRRKKRETYTGNGHPTVSAVYVSC